MYENEEEKRRTKREERRWLNQTFSVILDLAFPDLLNQGVSN